MKNSLSNVISEAENPLLEEKFVYLRLHLILLITDLPFYYTI